MSFDAGLAVGLALGKKKFSGGVGGDNWKYPADWIQIPEPAANEVYCVGTTSLSTNRIISVMFDKYGVLDDSATIDWGDGTTVAVNNTQISHTYVDGTGHLADSGMEQFLIRITMQTPSKWGSVRIECSSGAEVFALALAYGFDTAMTTYGNANRCSLHQITLPNMTSLVGTLYLCACYALKKVITPTKITAIGNALAYDYSLESIDLSEVTTIGENGLINTALKIINAPKLVSVGNCGLSENKLLREINAPLLASVGDRAMANDISLFRFTHAESCTFGANACINCPNLYPNPSP